MSAMLETADKRNTQLIRAVKALKNTKKEEAIAILCMWMSMEQVDHMLKTLEK